MTGWPAAPSTLAEGMEAITRDSPDRGSLIAGHGHSGGTHTGPTTVRATVTGWCHIASRPCENRPPCSGRVRLLPPCAALLGSLMVASCGAGEAGSVEAFCADLAEHGAALMNPAMTTQADVEDYLALHDEVGADVPLGIEEEWGVYADALRTASAVVPGDAAGIEAARRAMFAAEESAFAVYYWAGTNCALDLATLGPIARYDPAATTTTVPTTTTATGTGTTVPG